MNICVILCQFLCEIFSPVIQTRTNDQSHITTPCNCKEWNERNSQEAVFYKRLITILLSNLAIQVNLDVII